LNFLPSGLLDVRFYMSSQVLTDGRVFVAGGEAGTGGSTAEVFDPQTGVWTPVTIQSGVTEYYDSESEMLPDGTVLVAPVQPAVYGGTVIFNPATNSITQGPNLVQVGNQDEASWVKLADNSILTVDPFGTNSERYIPSANRWVADSVVPVPLYDSAIDEIGPGVLLPSGKAFFLGSTGNTAIYTPSGSTTPGTWSAGPVIPGGLGAPDGPAAMLTNGHVLFEASPPPSKSNSNFGFSKGISFFEYDPVENSYIPVSAPAGYYANAILSGNLMLDLPDGTVLVNSGLTSVLYVYKPSGSPLAAATPTITSITQNGDGSYHLTGTLLNGISEGAYYGDDDQMSTNRPLVRLTDANGNITYPRTYNWSSTGVATGTLPLTTEFAKPPNGTYSVVVVANGVASAATNLTVVTPTSRLVNISTRAQVGTGGNVLIPGFVISGSGTETLLIRADGPALTQFSVPGVLAQPILSVYNSAGTMIATNTGWGTSPNPSQLASAASQVGAFALSPGSADCALIVSLSAGSYTVQISGVNNSTGVALAEVYEISSTGTRLINISTRAQVGTGGNIIIPGFVITGNSNEQLLVRADGPALTQFGVTGVLAQPSLGVYNGAGVLIASNTVWGTSASPGALVSTAASVGAFSLASGSADSAQIVNLPAGSYTFQISGVNNSTGVALAEIYEEP
jgi:hypothetical protein